jgi:hypothetical protein
MIRYLVVSTVKSPCSSLPATLLSLVTFPLKLTSGVPVHVKSLWVKAVQLGNLTLRSCSAARRLSPLVGKMSRSSYQILSPCATALWHKPYVHQGMTAEKKTKYGSEHINTTPSLPTRIYKTNSSSKFIQIMFLLKCLAKWHLLKDRLYHTFKPSQHRKESLALCRQRTNVNLNKFF